MNPFHNVLLEELQNGFTALYLSTDAKRLAHRTQRIINIFKRLRDESDPFNNPPEIFRKMYRLNVETEAARRTISFYMHVKPFAYIMKRRSRFATILKAIDAVYFNGANKNGDHLVVGTARRKKNLVDAFLYLKINSSGLGVLETPQLPGTAMYQAKETDEYKVEGIHITPCEPMKKWKITYAGKMKEFGNREKVHDVRIYAIWTSNLPYFNFDKHMDAMAMAKSMAYEKWSRDYFKTLQENHQTHYEQFGSLEVSVLIDGTDKYKFTLDTLRDHSFGIQREWRTFHRYGLHFLSAENGDRICIGMICIPVTFSRLTMGYVYCAAEKQIYPVTSCDLSLYQHGEHGTPPLDYAFSFSAGSKTYTLQVNVVDSPHFYISKDWEVKVCESLCKFEINGVKAWGAAEWVYRNIQGKDVPDYVEEK